MSNVKAAAKELYDKAVNSKVRFPKIWEPTRVVQECGTIMLLHRTATGFDLDTSLSDLVTKYGKDESPSKTSKSSKRKHDAEAKEDSEVAEENTGNIKAEGKTDDDGDGSPSKKARKKEAVANEANRAVAEAIKEIGVFYFKNKENTKGGVFSKAAKAIRECEIELTTKKEALALKGVGKKVAEYILEFRETGQIERLEELRAGVA